MVLFFSACQKEQIEIKTNLGSITKNPNNSKLVLDYILSLGFARDSIKENADLYSVNGMIFPKNMNVSLNQNENKEEQIYYSKQNLIYTKNTSKIRVKIDKRAEANEGSVLRAMDNWNRVTGTSIEFIEVTGNQWDVLVTTGFVNPNAAAEGFVPMNGRPGQLLYINASRFNRLSISRGFAVLTHEFGHIVGLGHTNERGVSIPEVGGQDALSIMNSQMANSVTNFSANDLKAIRVLYPRTPYRVAIGRTGQVSWFGPVHYIKGYDISFEVRNGGANGPFITPRRTLFVNQPYRDGYFNIPIPYCECTGPYVVKAMVRTVYYDGAKSPWSSEVTSILH